MNVFISHSRADRAFAERLGSGIRALGANVVSDETRLRPGESFDHALREALEASDAVAPAVPEPGTAATAPSSRLELRGRLGKPELPSDVYGRAVFDGSKVATEALAKAQQPEVWAAGPLAGGMAYEWRPVSRHVGAAQSRAILVLPKLTPYHKPPPGKRPSNAGAARRRSALDGWKRSRSAQAKVEILGRITCLLLWTRFPCLPIRSFRQQNCESRPA